MKLRTLDIVPSLTEPGFFSVSSIRSFLFGLRIGGHCAEEENARIFLRVSDCHTAESRFAGRPYTTTTIVLQYESYLDNSLEGESARKVDRFYCVPSLTVMSTR